MKNFFSVEVIHINATFAEPAPRGSAASRAAPETQQIGSGDELGLARVRDALHRGVHCLAVSHEDHLPPRPRDRGVKQIAIQHFCSRHAHRHENGVILAALTFVHGQRIGERKARWGRVVIGSAVFLHTVDLPGLQRASDRKRGDTVRLLSANIQHADIAVADVVIGVILRNDDTVAVTESSPCLLFRCQRVDFILQARVERLYGKVGFGLHRREDLNALTRPVAPRSLLAQKIGNDLTIPFFPPICNNPSESAFLPFRGCEWCDNTAGQSPKACAALHGRS